MRSFAAHVQSDFRRHQSRVLNIAWWPLFVYRFGVWAWTLPQPLRFFCNKTYGLMLFFIKMTSGTLIPREATIGEDPLFPHVGQIKIFSSAVIGDRATIFHDVTIGVSIGNDGAPVIGNDVFIGPGAKILGPVKIGDGARIAANSLVISDIPAGANAIGVPARPIPAARPKLDVTAPG
jgi:serine O-acetyltransferase